MNIFPSPEQIAEQGKILCGGQSWGQGARQSGRVSVGVVKVQDVDNVKKNDWGFKNGWLIEKEFSMQGLQKWLAD
jgi:hypothetical protein